MESTLMIVFASVLFASIAASIILAIDEAFGGWHIFKPKKQIPHKHHSKLRLNKRDIRLVLDKNKSIANLKSPIEKLEPSVENKHITMNLVNINTSNDYQPNINL